MWKELEVEQVNDRKFRPFFNHFLFLISLLVAFIFCELFLSSPSFHEYNANGVIAFNNGILIWIPTEDLSWPSSVVQGSQHHITVEEVYRFGLDILEQSKKKKFPPGKFPSNYILLSINKKQIFCTVTLFPRKELKTLMRCKTVEKVVAFLGKLS